LIDQAIVAPKRKAEIPAQGIEQRGRASVMREHHP